ncbi:hypothetical protein ACH5RR_025875 [Cinchona calisaya]|uniref:Uncharacterized protein n=1 Tax=Cinchona calisaya TaxID=153742 RepID=A0ABD2Z217_9GENT
MAEAVMSFSVIKPNFQNTSVQTTIVDLNPSTKSLRLRATSGIINDRNLDTAALWIREFLLVQCKDDIDLFCVLCCELWKNRNSIIFDGIAKDLVAILTFSRKFLSACKEDNVPQLSQMLNNGILTESSTHLKPSFANFIVSFDGVVDHTNYYFTTGVVILNKAGNFVGGFAEKAEAMAAKDAALFAKDPYLSNYTLILKYLPYPVTNQNGLHCQSSKYYDSCFDYRIVNMAGPSP